MLIAALLEPIVGGLHRLRVPRALGALLAMLLLIAVFVAPAILLWNLTAGQFGVLVGRLREGVGRMRTVAADVLPVSDEQLDRMVIDVEARLQRLAVDALAGALDAGGGARRGRAGAVRRVLPVEGRAVDVGLGAGPAAGARPRRRRRGRRGRVGHGHPIRAGHPHRAVIDAIGIGVALAIIGVPLALPLALLVFVGAFVPYIGSTVSGAVAVLVAFAANGPVDALLVLAAVIAVQQLEGNLLEPFIVGWQVRLHPVVVVVVVFAGSLIAGIAGAMLAVPLAAVAYRVFRVLQERRTARQLVPAVPGQGASPRADGAVDDGDHAEVTRGPVAASYEYCRALHRSHGRTYYLATGLLPA